MKSPSVDSESSAASSENLVVSIKTERSSVSESGLSPVANEGSV